jgi:hypothetical protein
MIRKEISPLIPLDVLFQPRKQIKLNLIRTSRKRLRIEERTEMVMKKGMIQA